MKALLPLLESIRRELEERAALLAELERRVDEISRSAFSPEEELRSLVPEVAVQLRELRLCHGELERLGCSVLGKTPLTIRIQTHAGTTRKSLVWQHGREPHD